MLFSLKHGDFVEELEIKARLDLRRPAVTCRHWIAAFDSMPTHAITSSVISGPRLATLPPPRLARRREHQAHTPITLNRSQRCACGGICPRCSVSEKNRPIIRIHHSAPEVTAPLRARAATIGQDIYFHPGQYRPGAPDGDALIAHEMAHTRQTGKTARDGETAHSRQALEANANALARGETSQVLTAPPNMALCQTFDSETSEQRARRLTLLQSIRNAISRIVELRRTRSLIDIEVEVERGGVGGIVYGAHMIGAANEEFLTFEQRDVRLQRIVRSLMAMAERYEQAPLDTDFTAPTPAPAAEGGGFQAEVEGPPGSSIGSTSIGGSSAEWTDLQAAYVRHSLPFGRAAIDRQDSDWHYLDPAAVVMRSATRGVPRVSRGVALGTYLVVPDPSGDPRRYWHLSGYDRIPRGAAIVEVWSDDFGYYYMHDGGRIDIPSPSR